MNPLKYVLSINVPRRVPSNAAVAKRCTQANGACLAKRKTKLRTQKFDQSLISKTKGNHDPRNIRSPEVRIGHDNAHITDRKCGAVCTQSRSKTKSTVVSTKRLPLERNISVECIHRHSRRYSTNQITRIGSGSTNKRHNRQDDERTAERAKNPKDSRSREKDTASVLYEKAPRSYAQMIADYSESMCARSNAGLLCDNLNVNMSNRICRSPFSTLSTVPTNQNIVNNTRSNSSFTNSPNSYDEGAMLSYGGFDHGNNVETINRSLYKNYPEKLSTDTDQSISSYAKMIANYMDAMEFGCNTQMSRNNFVRRRNFPNYKSFTNSAAILNTKDVGDISIETLLNDKSTVKSNSASTVGNDNRVIQPKKQVDWMKKVENVIKDLKRAAVGKDDATNVQSAEEKQMLSSINDQARWLERVVRAHRKKTKIRETMLGRTPSSRNEIKQERSLETLESNYQQEFKNSGNPSNMTVSQYINRGPNTPIKKSTSKNSTSVGSTVQKEPKVELRMIPSQNESIVSINVDTMTSKTLDRLNSDMKELSVTVHSNKNKGSKTDLKTVNASSSMFQQSNKTGQQNVRSDFGSMHISISEESVPLKQIEFSINGKPVSELKSIVARAEKLDVVSSLDKVEIRIPFVNESAKATNEHTKGLAKSVSTGEPVLNLQISAKFNEAHMEKAKDTVVKAEKKNEPSTKSPEAPKPPPVIKPPQKANVGQSKSLQENVTDQVGRINIMDGKRSEGTDKNKKPDTFSGVSNSNRPSIRSNDVAFQRPEINAPDRKDYTNSPLGSGVGESNDQRTPSNMIPWWSSEDSFNKIRKKENNHGSTPANKHAEEKKIVMPRQQHTKAVESDKQERTSKSENHVDATTTRSPRKGLAKTTSKVDERKSLETSGRQTRDTITARNRYANPSASNVRISKTRLKHKNVSKLSKIVRNELKQSGKTLSKSDKVTTVQKVPSDGKFAKDKEKAQIEKTKKDDANELRKSATLNASSQSNVKSDLPKAQSNLSAESKPQTKTSENLAADVKSPKSHERNKTKKEDFEKKLQRKTRSMDALPDPRIKKLLESMRPIQKRKDGTLIDYGVKVQSRKRIRGTAPINLKTNVKSETLAAPTTTISKQENIKADKVSSIKNNGKQTINDESKKHVSENVRMDKSTNIKTAVKESFPETESVRLSKTKNTVNAKDTKSSGGLKQTTVKSTSSEKLEYIPLKGTVKPPKKQATEKQWSPTKNVKPENLPSTVSNSSKTPEIRYLGNARKAPHEEKKKVAGSDMPPLAGTVVQQNPKTSMDQTARKDQSKETSKNTPTTGAAPFAGTVVDRNLKSSESTVKNVRTVSSNFSSRITSSKVENNFGESRINTSKSEGRRTSSETKSPKKTPVGPAGLKSPNSRSYRAISDDTAIPRLKRSTPSSALTAKDGLRDDTTSRRPVTSDDATKQNLYLLMQQKDRRNSPSKMSFNNTDRPEKNILYSVWLQRFKNRIDDDKL